MTNAVRRNVERGFTERWVPYSSFSCSQHVNTFWFSLLPWSVLSKIWELNTVSNAGLHECSSQAGERGSVSYLFCLCELTQPILNGGVKWVEPPHNGSLTDGDKRRGMNEHYIGKMCVFEEVACPIFVSQCSWWQVTLKPSGVQATKISTIRVIHQPPMRKREWYEVSGTRRVVFPNSSRSSEVELKS